MIKVIMQYTHALVTIAAVDLETLVNFYTKLLEQNPVHVIPDVYAEFLLAGLRLGIFQPKKTHAAEFEASGKSQISLCLEVGSLELAIAHLIALGYPPSVEISFSSHGQEIYIYDPEGNRLILHQSLF